MASQTPIRTYSRRKISPSSSRVIWDWNEDQGLVQIELSQSNSSQESSSTNSSQDQLSSQENLLEGLYDLSRSDSFSASSIDQTFGLFDTKKKQSNSNKKNNNSDNKTSKKALSTFHFGEDQSSEDEDDNNINSRKRTSSKQREKKRSSGGKKDLEGASTNKENYFSFKYVLLFDRSSSIYLPYNIYIDIFLINLSLY